MPVKAWQRAGEGDPLHNRNIEQLQGTREELILYLEDHEEIGVDFLDICTRFFAVGVSGSFDLRTEASLVDSMAKVMRLRGVVMKRKTENALLERLKQAKGTG